MNLQAYIDDSSQDDEVFVLAGHLADSTTWTAFSQEWKSIIGLAPQDKDGFRRFKMAELDINPHNIWKIKAFYQIIDKYNIIPVGCCLRKSHLREVQSSAYLPGPTMSIRSSIDWSLHQNIFMILFRCLIEGIQSNRPLIAPEIPVNIPIDFIFDTQREESTVRRIWRDYVSVRPEGIRGLFGELPRFEREDNVMPLQAADLWAWWFRETAYRRISRRRMNPAENKLCDGFLDYIDTKQAGKKAIYIVLNRNHVTGTMLNYLRGIHRKQTSYQIKYSPR